MSLRTKELVILAGAAGSGKSLVASNLAVGLDVPLLYCAQDSPASIIARLTGLSLGMEINPVQNALSSPDRRDYIVEQMEGRHPNLILHRGAIEVERLADMCLALTEWIGHAPPVIIIDNLIDMIVPGYTPGDNSFYSVVLTALKRLANDFDTCVIVLHHVTRGGGTEHGQGQTPFRMNDLLFAGEREARHVWGVWNRDERVHIQILKQQDGPADPGGAMAVTLRWWPRLGKLTSWD